MDVCLGFQDQLISAAYRGEVDWFTDKIGGNPNWQHDQQKAHVCEKCQRPFSLVIQLNCQLDPLYYRTLYIFTCISSRCTGKNSSWQVWRCQKKVEENVNVESSDVTEHVQESSWCEDADDWGDEEEGSVSVATEQKSSQSDLKDSLHIFENKKLQCSKETEIDDLDSLSCIKLHQINIHDIEAESSLDEPSNNEPAHFPVISESVEMTNENVGNMMGLLATQCESYNHLSAGSLTEEQSSRQFLSYFISSMPESQVPSYTDNKHITKLLKDYERREGSCYREEFMEDSSGSAERYEKAEIKHGDKTLYKFKKAVDICPEQCLRYQFGGTPLLISTLQDSMLSKAVPPCPVCGEDRVFELQLMPALSSILKVESEPAVAVEFASVLIFSCRGSCWQQGDFLRQEVAFLMDYPDSGLFQK